MNTELYDFLMNFITNWVPAIAFTIIALTVAVYVVRKLFAYHTEISILNNLVTQTLALITGWALLCVSAAMNMGFGLRMAEGFPSIAEYAVYIAVMAGAINLAGGWAIYLMRSAKAAGDKLAYTWARVAYVTIVCFSLLTASTMLLTGHTSINTQIVHADTQVAINAEKIAANRAAIRESANLPMGAGYTGPSTMKNANGRNVSVSTYCKPGGWYANNSAACQQYLIAQANSGAAQNRTALRNENISLMQASLDEDKAKPTPLIPSFMGFIISPAIAFFFMAAVLELAAGTCLWYNMIGSPPPSKNSSWTALQSAADSRQTVRQSKGSQSKSKGSQSGRSDNSANLKHAAEAPPLKGQKRAYTDAIGEVQPEGSIPTGLLEDLLYQLATYNPKAQLNADHVIKIIADNRGGVSVGKQRLLNIIASDRMSDIVLTSTTNGRKVYSFKQVAGASNVQQPASVQGLPTSQSALSQGGAADHGRRTG